MQFSRGPYDEILAPPLTSGLDPEAALAQMVAAVEASGHEITIPKRGESRRGIINVAFLYCHQINLAAALSGTLTEDPAAVALARAILDAREPLSLRPLGLESLYFATFAPVLQRLAGDNWRVGRADWGRTLVFEATDPAQALEHARQVYVKWTAAEDEKWADWAKNAVRQVPPHYQRLVWLVQLTQSEDLRASLGGEVALERLGKHSTYRLSTARGERIIDVSSPARAVALAVAVRQQTAASPLPAFDAPTMLRTLDALAAPSISQQGDTWTLGPVRAKAVDSTTLGLIYDQTRYALKPVKGQLSLSEVTGKKRTLDPLTINPHWPASERTQIALRWAAWLLVKRK